MPDALTAETLRTLLHYEPATGVFTWLRRDEKTQYDRTWNARYAGREAGFPWRGTNNVYRQIVLLGRHHYAHRLAFLYMTGEWPQEADHRDGDGLNNRWGNLRDATRTQNGGNHRPRRDSRAGLKGVYRCSTGRFRAHIGINGTQRHLGYFDTADEAHAAYVKAARQHFGEFARVS